VKTFLHVGCGPRDDRKTTKTFDGQGWQELRLDIDPKVNPDIVGTMIDMSSVADGQVDAVFSSHNIEHLYPHEIPLALAEFKRVLRPGGFVVVTCPDLQGICALVADDQLTDPAYDSPAGPIAPIDVIYGHRSAMAAGNLFMAHRCGFTEKVLFGTLRANDFASIATMKRGYPHFDLWAVAMVGVQEEASMLELAMQHFPDTE
jgi:predicted SAM-dependent methyltransferase